MRAAFVFVLGLGLVASAVGCAICQHTAGVCDCDPPPVQYVLQPPPRPVPLGGMIQVGGPVAPPVVNGVAAPILGPNAPVPEPVPPMPRAVEPPAQ